ncbi:MAG: hypothetical protein WDM70_06115 [Nitrosomonadales bacterium]
MHRFPPLWRKYADKWFDATEAEEFGKKLAQTYASEHSTIAQKKEKASTVKKRVKLLGKLTMVVYPIWAGASPQFFIKKPSWPMRSNGNCWIKAMRRNLWMN